LMKHIIEHLKLINERLGGSKVEVGSGRTDNPWELYRSLPGWEKAAAKLEAAHMKCEAVIDKALEELKAADEEFNDVQLSLRKWGAANSEPNSFHGRRLINKLHTMAAYWG